MDGQGNSNGPGHVQETLLLTTKEAAALINVGERTLWRWSRSGLAPKPIKIGDAKKAPVRFSRATLLQWIAAGCPRTDGRADR
jgi:predicted DNA-binding transcriptional regulator AlpA